MIWSGPLAGVQPEIMHSAVLVLTFVTFHGLWRLSIVHNLSAMIGQRVLRGGFFFATVMQVRTAISCDHTITSIWSAGSYTFNTNSLMQYRFVQFPVELGHYPSPAPVES
jgi:hypothetical protein